MKIFAATAFLLFSFSAFAQNPQTTPSQTATEDDEIVRISSELVLVDALVLNKEGKQVTDLTAEDFEVLQDGKSQKITNFAYVKNDRSDASQTSPETSSKNKKDKNSLPVPPVNLRANRGRIITFVIDDGNCLATIYGIGNIRDAIKKFIDEQMQPDDKVAIYRTRGGSSLMQMYTSNKEVLRRILNKVVWLPSGCESAFEAQKYNNTVPESRQDAEFRNANENRARENQVIGTIGVMGFVIDRLKNLPERKVVFLLSEGIVANFGTRANDALRELVDKASRASVVVNAFSAKALDIPGFLSAQDDVSPGITGGTDLTIGASADKIEEERALSAGLAYLSYSTGGTFIRNMNDLTGEIKRILDTEKGYYLLGYQPDEETFKGRSFHRLEIRLKRPGLTISSRKGFFGRADQKTAVKNKSAESPLFQAISSPLRENGMDIRLTTLVGSEAREGNFIRALIHIKGADLTFTDEADGVKKVVLDVVAVALDEKGKVIEEFNRSYPIRIPKQGFETVQRNGLDYTADIPIKKPGFYNFRLAVRDNNSGRLGSAGDYVEIPDLKKTDFMMSGLITTTVTTDGKPLVPKARPVNAAFAPVFTTSIASIRQYAPNSVLAYSYTIYNARLDDATRQPKLTTQVRLFKDGKMLVEGKETPAEIPSLAGASRLENYGLMKLSPEIEPGEYFLQIILRDKIGGKTASQWIDFEIVR